MDEWELLYTVLLALLLSECLHLEDGLGLVVGETRARFSTPKWHWMEPFTLEHPLAFWTQNPGALDGPACRLALAKALAATRLARLGGAFFLYASLLGLPLAYAAYNRRPWVLPAALGVWVLLWWGQALLAYGAARRLHGKGLGTVITCLCSPAAAARAGDRLLRGSLRAWHPLCAAAAVMPASRFVPILQASLRELAGPASHLSPLPLLARPPLEEAPQDFGRRLHAWALAEHWPVEGWDAAPLRDSPQARAWCPRCHSQFAHSQGRCQACGVELKPF